MISKNLLVASLVVVMLAPGCFCKWNIPKLEAKAHVALTGLQVGYGTYTEMAEKEADTRVINYLVVADQALSMLGPILQAFQDRVCVPEVIVNEAVKKAEEALAVKP